MDKRKGMYLSVITPEGEFYGGLVESIVVRTLDGYLGLQENRMPACILLHDEGSLRFREKDAEPGSEMIRLSLSGGIAFVDGEVTVYTDSAQIAEDAEPA